MGATVSAHANAIWAGLLTQPRGSALHHVGSEHLIRRRKRRSQAEEGDEGDTARGALIQHRRRRPVNGVESVLYAGDLGILRGPQQMLTGDIAQPDAADQSLVAGSDHDRKQFVEALVGALTVHQPQIDHRELIDAERSQVGLDVAAEVGGVGQGQPPAGIVAAGSDLADQRQVGWIRMQGFADELVGDIRARRTGRYRCG